MNWWITCMKKYADFSGRARRAEYWMFVLFNIFFASVALYPDIADVPWPGHRWLYNLFLLAIILPTWAVTVRRLHDVGKSGWWIFINLIPFIGSIWLFVLTVTDSQSGDNEYGANPKLIKTKIPSTTISLLTGMFVPLVPISWIIIDYPLVQIITNLWNAIGDYPLGWIIMRIIGIWNGIGDRIISILRYLPVSFLITGLPSLLLSAIANDFLKKSEASDRSIMFVSMAIGVVIGIIAFVPVFLSTGQ